MKSFNGDWYGNSNGKSRGTIKGNVLTWPNGKRSEVTYDDKSHIFVTLDGKTYKGALNKPSNGSICWNDGDIWTNTIPGND